MIKSVDKSEVPEISNRHPKHHFLSGPYLVWKNITDYFPVLSNFIQRDIQLKYRNSLFGFFWSLIEPLMLSGVYYILFIVIAGRTEPEYPFWVIIGVITWTFFSKILNSSVVALTRNGELIKQVYFPREIFALSITISNLIVTIFSFLVVIPFMIYLNILPTTQLIMVPLGLILVSSLGLGLGLMFSGLNTLNRDIEHLFRIITRAGLFLSPVMWTVKMLPESRQSMIEYLMLNPMVVPISMIRSGFDGTELGIDSFYIAYSVIFCLSSLILGTMIFKRYEPMVVKYL